MKPDEVFYIITRYDNNGKMIWERLSRKKQGYYSTVGSINSFWGKLGDRVTLEEVTVSGHNVTLIEEFQNEKVTP